MKFNRLFVRPIIWTVCLLSAVVGIYWLPLGQGQTTVDAPAPEHVTTMDSPSMVYSPGWTVTAEGADPGEPEDPWNEPAGVIEFDFEGKELALQIALGDYWGYLFVTIDGLPASELPIIRENVNSQDQPTGYKPLYEPDNQTPAGPGPTWLTVHRSTESTAHQARIEVWRGWGQTPLRAVAVDAFSSEQRPAWPGVLMLILAGWLALIGVGISKSMRGDAPTDQLDEPKNSEKRIRTSPPDSVLFGLWIVAVALLGISIVLDQWLLALSGLALLGLISLPRPAIWLATLLFGLPFYYTFTLPLLPVRSFSLIEVGIFGGLVVWLASIALSFSKRPAVRLRYWNPRWTSLALAAVISWALVATVAATRTDVALYEWRTVFLAAGAFALLLGGVLATGHAPMSDRRLLLYAWLAGATAVAAVGLWHFASRSMLIEAEGVTRIRAFYGSPNNLALYLERSLAVTLALGLFMRARRLQVFWLIMAAVQGIALLLTFSKGALFIGVPALLATLWLGGFWLLRKRHQSTRPLWLLAGVALLGLLLLLPFLGTERLAGLFDLSQGTGFLRLQLWRSSWQMALDHLPFGVGPDNFLYAYRSGYILPQAWQEPNLNHPHNWILDWWTRLGLPGLVLGVTFWGAGIAVLWRRFRHGNDEVQVWALGFLAATVAILAHGLIDLSYALPDLMIVWVLLFFLIDDQ